MNAASMNTAALLQELRRICGPQQVQSAGDDLSAYEQDWRGRTRGKALAVVLPATTAEVAAVVQACAASGHSIVPQGGNTGLVLGGIPDASGQQVVLSLRRMQRVRAIDPSNLTLTVEAGCLLQNVQEAAAQADLLFPLSLAAQGSCTIGGNLATNAGGTQVLRYGNARELCLGLEVVNAQGQIWQGLSGLRKDNTGYDLRDLMIGSEGTLGVITAATLKMFPRPQTQLTAWAASPSMHAAVRLLNLAQQHCGAELNAFEVMGQLALGLVQKHRSQLRVPMPQAPYGVLLEIASTEGQAPTRSRLEHLLEVALQEGVASDAILAESLAQAQQLWHIRESIPLAQAREGLNIKHDIALPVSCIPNFVAQTEALLQQEAPGVRLIHFGHLGDGNLHYNVQAPEGVEAKAFVQAHSERIQHIVHQSVHALGGSISAEHGVGALKVDALTHYKDPTALSMMRSIKQALDPKGVLNPQRVVKLQQDPPIPSP